MSGAGWRPAAGLEALRLRARILRRIRAFFERRGVLEVDTPALSAAAATDPALESFCARAPGSGETRYLHTSPEFPMKRLLAAGYGDIYQVCKVFRAGEAGRLHNPEFTLLEWYRLGHDHHCLMDEVEALLHAVLDGLIVPPPVERLSYRALFRRYAGVDGLAAAPAELRRCLRAHGVPLPAEMAEDRAAPWRDLLLTQVVEPRLRDRALFVYDYPADQAALARLRPGTPPVAERFELYLHGVELANGFHELADAAEQRQRFERERERRRAAALAEVPADGRLLAALEAGLPDCAGVALGVDRLVMIAAGAADLGEVLAFPSARA